MLHPCQNHATCIDSTSLYQWNFTPAHYYCQCKSSWTGENCQGIMRFYIKILEASFHIRMLMIFFILVMCVVSFLNRKFYSDSKCKACDTHAICDGSKCVCEQGYSGNGLTCYSRLSFSYILVNYLFLIKT